MIYNNRFEIILDRYIKLNGIMSEKVNSILENRILNEGITSINDCLYLSFFLKETESDFFTEVMNTIGKI